MSKKTTKKIQLTDDDRKPEPTPDPIFRTPPEDGHYDPATQTQVRIPQKSGPGLIRVGETRDAKQQLLGKHADAPKKIEYPKKTIDFKITCGKCGSRMAKGMTKCPGCGAVIIWKNAQWCG